MSQPLYVEDVLESWKTRPAPSERAEPESWLPGGSPGLARSHEELEARLASWASEVGEELSRRSQERASRLPELLTNELEGSLASLKIRRRTVVPVAGRFAALAESWRTETLLESSMTRMAMHRAYQQIIGLGYAVVPLILAELEREPNYWFWALTSITGEDPAAGEDTLEGATACWLTWGREHGYVG